MQQVRKVDDNRVNLVDSGNHRIFNQIMSFSVEVIYYKREIPATTIPNYFEGSVQLSNW